MANLILMCCDCGQEVEDRAGVYVDHRCLDCHAVKTLESYKVEAIRLWNKYNRYAGKGHSVAHLDEQIQAKFRRAMAKLHDSAPGADGIRIFQLTTRLVITEAQEAAVGFNAIIRAA